MDVNCSLNTPGTTPVLTARRLVGPQASLGVSEKRKISCSNRDSNPGPSSPQPSRPMTVFRLRSKYERKNFETHFSTFCFAVKKRVKYEKRRQPPQQTWESQIKVTLLGVVCTHRWIVYRSFITIFQLAVRKLSCQNNVYLTGIVTDILSYDHNSNKQANLSIHWLQFKWQPCMEYQTQ